MGLWTQRMGPEGVDRRDSFELSWTADVPSHSGRTEFGTTEGSSIVKLIFYFRTYSNVLRWYFVPRPRRVAPARARASCGR